METRDLYSERQRLRDELAKIDRYHLENRIFGYTKEEQEIQLNLQDVHGKILHIELNNKDLRQQRVVYSVCGWSKKHGYFRTKRFQSESLEEAVTELKLCKKEANWNIPTLIVKEIYLRKKCPATIDFDGDYRRLSSCDIQEIVEKSMCGVKGVRWKDLITIDMDRFTY